MSAKITLTLAKDKNGTDEAMAETLALLAATDGGLPLAKLTITIECENEDADTYAADLKRAMSRRPVGIDAKVKVTTEEGIDRQRLTSVTPMDKAWSN